MKRCLIFANGAPNDGPMVRDVLTSAPDALTIAADGGARVAREARDVTRGVPRELDSYS